LNNYFFFVLSFFYNLRSWGNFLFLFLFLYPFIIKFIILNFNFVVVLIIYFINYGKKFAITTKQCYEWNYSNYEKINFYYLSSMYLCFTAAATTRSNFIVIVFNYFNSSCYNYLYYFSFIINYFFCQKIFNCFMLLVHNLYY
jgi:hypothetical protein